MILKVEPIYKAINQTKKRIKKNKKVKIILFSAKGKKFDQKMAKKFSKLDELILICGRYEGVDERVAKHIADMEISVGDYVLTGGEIPAMILVDAITRLLPGAIKKESLKEESFKNGESGEYPQYTRPEVFTPVRKNSWRVPRVLLSGHHRNIGEWRRGHRRNNN